MLYFSTALRNGMLNGTSLAEALDDGVIDIYSGPQPANADAAPTGTKLLRVTVNSAAVVVGVAATNTVVSNNSNVSDADTVTVNGKVYTFKTTLTATEGQVLIGADADASLTNLAHAINGTGGTNGTDYVVGQANGYVSASTVTSHTITLTARTKGAGGNAITLAKSATTLSVGGANFSGGVTPSGLGFDAAASGILSKAAAETWSGVGLAAGTAGWFRFKGNATDSDGVSTSLARLDGSIANSGADLLLANTAITVGAPVTIDVFALTLPAS